MSFSEGNDLRESKGVSDTASASRNALFRTCFTPVERLTGAAYSNNLISSLKAGGETYLHRSAVEAMSVNETSFFRDVQPFEMLRFVILPGLMERRKDAKRLRIWSAACSTGQEAYSLAMLIVEHFPELLQWDLRIMGTDTARQALEYSRRGRYRRPEVNRGLPARMLMKHMIRDGEEWEITPQVRSLCEFHHLNLGDSLSHLPQFDLVMMRNVLLYFSHCDRSTLFGDVHKKMASDGYLILGSAEQAEDSTDMFETEFAEGFCFYRPTLKG